MSFREKYINAYKQLGIDLKEEDGFSEEEINANEKEFGARYPEALREYFLLAGNHYLNYCDSRLVIPWDKYYRQDPKSIKARDSEHFIAILEENQSCEHWGIKYEDFEEIDPFVYGDIEANYEYGPYETKNRCSDYLVLLPFTHVIYAFENSERVEVSYPVVEAIRKKWKSIGSDYGRGECFVSSGRVIWIEEDEEDYEEFGENYKDATTISIRLVARNMKDFWSIDEELKLNLMDGIKIEPGPKVRCILCDEVIQSKHRYDRPRCKCGKLRVWKENKRCSISFENGSVFIVFNSNEKITIDKDSPFEILDD